MIQKNRIEEEIKSIKKGSIGKSFGFLYEKTKILYRREW